MTEKIPIIDQSKTTLILPPPEIKGKLVSKFIGSQSRFSRSNHDSSQFDRFELRNWIEDNLAWLFESVVVSPLLWIWA